jgi:hypothetical protein
MTITTKFPVLVQFEFHPASKEAAAQVDAGLAGERADLGDSGPSVMRNAVGVATSV